MLSGARRCVCFHSVILQKETGNQLMVLFYTPWWWSSKTIGALMIIRLVPWEAKCWCLSYRELGIYSSDHSPVPSQVAFVIWPSCSIHLPDGELALQWSPSDQSFQQWQCYQFLSLSSAWFVCVHELLFGCPTWECLRAFAWLSAISRSALTRTRAAAVGRSILEPFPPFPVLTCVITV